MVIMEDKEALPAFSKKGAAFNPFPYVRSGYPVAPVRYTQRQIY
jgi:hypothetical protein